MDSLSLPYLINEPFYSNILRKGEGRVRVGEKIMIHRALFTRGTQGAINGLQQD